LTKTTEILEPLDTSDYFESTEEVDRMLKEARAKLEASDLKEALEKLDRIPEEYKRKLRDTSDLKENVEGLSKSLKKGLDSEDKEKKVWKGSKVFNELLWEEAGLRKNKRKFKVIK
jgi:predicted phage gp36 major capsid-like protein